MEYKEEDFLKLSGLQHYIFCDRQWALIHIENQWAENAKTVDGEFFHKNAHNSISHEKRGNILITRGMYIHSRELGVSGQCDVVEYHRDNAGIQLPNENGKWVPLPVEYKRGHAKIDDSDKVQVCAQAMCLEEMYCCAIPMGAIFYGETRRRQDVNLTLELRQLVKTTLKKMHELYGRGKTPKARLKSGCRSCSLKEICVPELPTEESVESYITHMVQLEK